MQMAKRKATESQWFLGDRQKLLVREVRVRLLLLALLKWTMDRPTEDTGFGGNGGGILSPPPKKVHQKWFYAPYRIVEMFFQLI